mmetsp:Transcript_30879/g.70250  ORF Transcript_30879/g.70250 Transcript_30879/m.70250 type:complete len:208 (-) Transcript_30879:41-664(-)
MYSRGKTLLRSPPHVPPRVPQGSEMFFFATLRHLPFTQHSLRATVGLRSDSRAHSSLPIRILRGIQRSQNARVAALLRDDRWRLTQPVKNRLTGASSNQHRHTARTLTRRCQMQRRGSFRRLHIRVGLLIQKDSHIGCQSISRGIHESSLPLLVLDVRHSLRSKQYLHKILRAAHARIHQRSPSFSVAGIGVCAGCTQYLGGLQSVV